MKNGFFIALLLSYCFTAFGQNIQRIDSLKTELKKSDIHDTSRILLFLDLSSEFSSFSKSDALSVIDSALYLARKSSSKKFELKAYLHISLAYFYQAEIDSALIFSFKALEMVKEFQDLKTWESVVFEHIGHSYYYQGNYNKALQYFLAALENEKSTNNAIRIQLLENKVGNCYSYLHNWEKAVEAFQKSLSICEQLNLESDLADVCVNIGALKDDMGEDSLALEYYLRALAIYEQKGNQSGMSICYTNLGDYYDGKNDHKRALEYFNKSLEISQHLNDDYGIAVDLFNIADEHLFLGDTSLARRKYSNSLKIAEKAGFAQLLAHIYYVIGRLAFTQGNNADAIKYGLESLEGGIAMANPETIMEACLLLTDSYKKQGQYYNALEFLSKYQKLYDSIYTAERSQQIIEISTKYETANKERQNAILKSDNAIQKKNQSLLIISLIVSLIILIFVLLLWIQRKKTFKKLNKQKQYFEGLIDNSEDFIVVIDIQNRIKYISPSYSKKMGWSADELIEQDLFKHIHPEDLPESKKAFKEHKNGNYSIGWEFRLQNNLGEWLWMASRGKNLIDDPEINGMVINIWDITERKNSEKLVLLKQKEIAESQKLAKIGSWIININTGNITLSKEAMHLLGEEERETSLNADRFMEDYFVEEDIEFSKGKLAKAIESINNNVIYKERFEARAYRKNPDGIIYLELWAEFIDDGIIHGVTQDITEKREAEKQIIESEKSYRELFNNAYDAIYVLNSKGEFIDVNNGAEIMYGYPKEFFIGKTPEFLSAPGKNNLSEVQLKIVDAYNGISSQIEFWGLDCNGRVFPKVTKLTPAYYFGEKVIIAYAIDITELVNTQIKVAQKEKEYQRIFNAFPDIYFKSSSSGSILEVSPSAYNISGYTREEVIGNKSGFFFYDKNDYNKLRRLFENRDTVKDIDIKLKTKTNKYIDCSFSARLIHNDDGVPIEMEGVIRDISDRVKDLKKLVESEEKLKKANLTKDKVFSIISHDLRGPISTNKSIVDLIVNEFERIDKNEIFRLLDSYKPTADATYFLLENLLSWSRSQMGLFSFNPGLNPIKSIINENIELHSSQAQLKKIKLINKVQSNLIGYFDKAMMDIVLRNLLSNAIKFTDQNGKVEIKSSVNGDYIFISVIDTGVGINPKQLKNLFGDLDTNKITTIGTDNEKGAGLGIVLCKEFIEFNGGEIDVVSKEGTGSTFMFSVPLYKC